MTEFGFHRWAARSGVGGCGRCVQAVCRTERQTAAGPAVGHNSLALPVAAGVFEPIGFVLRPEVGAISMAGSSIIVALNAVSLKRLRLPDRPASSGQRRPD